MVVAAIAKRFFGSVNDRRIKKLQPQVDAINALEPEMEKLGDDELRGPHPDVPRRVRRRQKPRRPAGSGLRDGARGGQTFARPTTFRYAADRRDGSQRPCHFRDAYRRRQDAGRHAAGLSQRHRAKGRACRHRQRLPRLPRRRVDGPGLQIPRAERRRHRPRTRRHRAQGGLRCRRHLRHQQRIRLRLSARQHEILARPDGSAWTFLRHRRRSRLDPDRRGAHSR